MNYSGYLSGHTLEIERLHQKGRSPEQIAQILFDLGLRSPHRPHDQVKGMTETVRYFVQRYIKYQVQKKKAKNRTPRWQTWTPQMQAEEFEEEYGTYSV